MYILDAEIDLIIELDWRHTDLEDLLFLVRWATTLASA